VLTSSMSRSAHAPGLEYCISPTELSSTLRISGQLCMMSPAVLQTLPYCKHRETSKSACTLWCLERVRLGKHRSLAFHAQEILQDCFCSMPLEQKR